VLECLRQAEGRLLAALAVLIDDDVCVGLTQDEIVKWHITAELDRCVPWPCAACSLITIRLIRFAVAPTGGSGLGPCPVHSASACCGAADNMAEAYAGVA
jgi:hypothetical protein